MFSVKKTALVSVAAACAGLLFASTANAAGISNCVHLSKQVAAAIDSAQAGKAKDDAAAQQLIGRQYCAISMYDRGVAHYSKALELLGQPSKS